MPGRRDSSVRKAEYVTGWAVEFDSKGRLTIRWRVQRAKLRTVSMRNSVMWLRRIQASKLFPQFAPFWMEKLILLVLTSHQFKLAVLSMLQSRHVMLKDRFLATKPLCVTIVSHSSLKTFQCIWYHTAMVKFWVTISR